MLRHVTKLEDVVDSFRKQGKTDEQIRIALALYMQQQRDKVPERAKL